MFNHHDLRDLLPAADRFVLTIVAALISGYACNRAALAGEGSPSAFTYQGLLKQAGSAASTPTDFQFKLFNASMDGLQFGSTISADAVSLSADGTFTVELDFGPGVFTGGSRWLEIDVRNPAGSGTFTTLQPRQRLTPAPYALFALSAPIPNGGVGSAHLANDAASLFKVSGRVMTSGGGNIGIGTTTPAYPLVVQTSGNRAIHGSNTAATGAAVGIFGESYSANGVALYGSANAATGNTVGILGFNNSTGGIGVYGSAEAPTGTTFGVSGSVLSPNGYAGYFTGGRNYFEGNVGIGTSSPVEKLHVLGGTDTAPAGGGYLVAGSTTSTNLSLDNNEIMARNNGLTAALALNANGGNVHLIQSGTGDVGIGTSNPLSKLHVDGGAGVLASAIRAIVEGASSIAVYGVNHQTTGTAYGVWGRTDSTDSTGRAVYGQVGVNLGSAKGVWGETAAPSGDGVYGYATSATGSAWGVRGETDSTASTARGVYGTAVAPAVAVYASGNSTTTGTKSFQIDHPLDPENKWLNHYCTESVEPVNFYSGNVILNGAGEASVELPEWFESINRDFRYQLTAIGAPAPNLHVAQKIANNTFKIAGGQPGLEISWRVEATRDDLYVRHYGAPAVIEKPAEAHGKYLHPELYNQPPELGVHFRQHGDVAPKPDQQKP